MIGKFIRLQLHWQIFIALGLAVLVGLVFTPGASVLGLSLVSALNFIGTLFLNALKMLIVPLITASIVTGMMELRPDMLGRLGYKTLLFYLISSLIAILIGLFVVNLLQPGIVDGAPALDIIGLSADTEVHCPTPARTRSN